MADPHHGGGAKSLSPRRFVEHEQVLTRINNGRIGFQELRLGSERLEIVTSQGDCSYQCT